MTVLHLIRHAHNDYVQQGRLPGRLSGIHLDETGRAQADRLAQHFAAIRLEAVYSSPLERAQETAQPIAAAHGLNPIVREGLSEVDIGDWQGLTLKAARRRKLWPLIQYSPSRARFPGGEAYPEAQSRIVSELDGLLEAHSGSFACVSHADPIKLAIAHYVGLPLDLFQRLRVDPASVSELHLGSRAVSLGRLNWTR